MFLVLQACSSLGFIFTVSPRVRSPDVRTRPAPRFLSRLGRSIVIGIPSRVDEFIERLLRECHGEAESVPFIVSAPPALRFLREPRPPPFFHPTEPKYHREKRYPPVADLDRVSAGAGSGLLPLP